MTVIKYNEELTSSMPASRLFRAAVLDGMNLWPKILPDVVASAAIVEGDGGAGSIKMLRFTQEVPFDYVKERVDMLDKVKMEYKGTVLEGAGLGKKIEYLSLHVKFEDTMSGGCMAKTSLDIKFLGGEEIKEEVIHATARRVVLRMCNVLDAYLGENPDAYAV